jgi:hypothetical protein
MFVIRIPYIPILQQVVSHCRLPYVSTIHEISGDGVHFFDEPDGVHLCGIALELSNLRDIYRSICFFGHPSML